MPVPLRQSVRVGAYLMRQRLARREKFPLIVELEPLFQCNLACSGCGKIQQPDHVLRQRMPVEQAVDAIEKKLDLFEPSPYFAWAVHIDGLRERHDESVEREGVFDKAVSAIKAAQKRGFRVTTNTTFFTHDSPQTIQHVLDFLNDELKVDQMMISPAYAYEKAPDQDHFLGVEQTRELFSKAFADGRRRKWRLNHTPLFLDFLEGKVDFQCTAWGIPSYSLFGWQRPCYLMADGYAKTYKELLETTDWDAYGRGRDPRCDNCMAHCGYEPTAVLETTRSVKQSIRAVLSG
jgi:hopanoid biosynthesis associated radical SAM protein HpnH